MQSPETDIVNLIRLVGKIREITSGELLIFGGFFVLETSVWGRGWDWNNRGRGRAPLEKHFSRDLLNEGAVAAEIVAETISLASIDAGSKWPELDLPAAE